MRVLAGAGAATAAATDVVAPAPRRTVIDRGTSNVISRTGVVHALVTPIGWRLLKRFSAGAGRGADSTRTRVGASIGSVDGRPKQSLPFRREARQKRYADTA